MISKSNFFLTSIIFLIFASQLSLKNVNWTPLTGIGIFVFVSIFLSILIFENNLKIKFNWFLSIIFLGLIISSIISFLVTGNLKPIYVYGALILLFITTNTFSKNIINLDKFIINIAVGICITGLIIIFLGLDEPFLGKKVPFSFYRFKGFFNNSNSMGMFSACIICIIIGILYSYYNEIKKSEKIFFSIFLFLNVIFLTTSNSRASIFSVILVVTWILCLEIYKSINLIHLKIKINILKRFLIIVGMVFIGLIIIYFTGLFESTINKFYWKGDANSVEFRIIKDISDGRLKAWMFAIDNWNWFGHKDFHYLASSVGYKIFGHNTWLSHLSNYGLLATLFFVSWIFYMIIWSWLKI